MQDLQCENQIIILPLTLERPQDFFILVDKMGIPKDQNYLENMVERHFSGEVEILLSKAKESLAGYCILNWRPKYTYFRLHNIPEIQDLRVIREFRQNGIGAALIRDCERRAKDKNTHEMGIGVGLDASFGPAQRLYVKLGYVPDGNGISYDRKQVSTGEFRPIDENLCLMMTKKLI
jgi:GNAT superfamily N-acetyltransferase